MAEAQIGERMKELQFFFSLSTIIERKNITLDELYMELTELLPKSLKYEEVACARIEVDDYEFHTENFAMSKWMQSVPVKVSEVVVGRIEVGYLEERPEKNEGPFLKEEILLLEATAERLGRITERKHAEKIINNNEKLFRELIESLPQLIWTCRVDGPCDYLSRQWVEYTGVPEAEQLGYKWLEQLHPEDRDKTVTQWLEKVKTGNSFDIEFRILRNDGVYHWFKTSAVPMRDEEGNILKWFGSNTDIEEIKKAEEQLRNFNKELEQKIDERTKELQRSNKLLDETGRLARVGGWEINIKDNSLYWSETTRKIHEVDPGFVPNVESGINFYTPEARPVISQCVDKAIRLGESFDVELELITAKKNRLWVRAFGEAYRENGEIVKIGGVFQDINKRKLASEEIRQLNAELEDRVILRTAQLEATNKELEAFAYSVSHDLRAPLRAVDGFSRIVMEDYGDKLGTEGERMLGLIRSNTQKMDQLINDLLNLSRVSRRDLRYSDIDMTEMVTSVFNETAPPDVKGNIKFQVDKLPDAFADPTFLKQVWINLITNAIKFSSKKREPKIKIGSRIENHTYTYFINDNGVGFNQEYAHKLFGVFQRLHKSEDFEGTGVGLAIVQRIIHRFDGKVWAESVEGKGATFYFSLPARK